ncbi:protein translocase subunit SecF [Spirulina subsalsa FACHB-351]|uniref:Protein-export membrane protein SecF n=1 Tax=Spirulina subsalsa FACHB-351 TaxID=234711 RepID=A0ABT3L4W0_9CYAN|nr:protein translocase subunit SecF [Spirulina subsalsa]MCW6036129.1 protein translocase subunit SecF [Spirulina subsalsa FACHB-351]
MKLDIIKQQRLWWIISSIACLISLIAMVVCWTQFGAPLRPGLDFVGGTRLQLSLACVATDSCGDPIDVSEVRNILAQEGLEGSSIQIVENYTLSVRTQTLTDVERTALQQLLTNEIGEFDPQTVQIDTVGPTIGQELFISGIGALLTAFFGIVVYLSFRFKFDYAIFAILALVHDVLIAAGVFAILGLTLGVEIDSLFLVALLTIIGFSVNDTVVIYDRIRETSANSEGGESISDIVDRAVNDTLTRSINTSVTTVLPLFAIFLFGGETLKFFALALIVGFISGAYSSIFIASTLLALWRERQGVGTMAVTDTPVSEEV